MNEASVHRGFLLYRAAIFLSFIDLINPSITERICPLSASSISPPAGADLQSVPQLRKVWFSNLRIIYTAALLIMLVVRVC